MPNPNITNSADYYDDNSRHGEYQYVTLENVINNFLASRDSDSYVSNASRHRVLHQARRGMRELYYDVVREIRAIELELSPRLNIELPPDYVNYVRISWVGQDGLLRSMAVDNKMSIAQEYLQDHEYYILFDGEGCPLEGSKGLNEPDITSGLDINKELEHTSYNFCSKFQPNKNASRIYNNGRYRIDKHKGVIQFGSDSVDKFIVLEYISDGLYTGCEGRPEPEIRIHKFAETPLIDWIYWKLIEQRRNVPMNEKTRARREYYNSKRIAKRRINTIRADELLQVFKGSSKWTK